MNKTMTSIFGASWRTALAGYSSAALAVAWAAMDAYQAGAFNGKTGFALVYAVLAIIKGVVSKDAKVTGTPDQNKPESNP